MSDVIRNQSSSADAGIDRSIVRAWLKGMEVAQLRQVCQKGLGEIFFFSQYVYRPLTLHITRAYAWFGIGPSACTIHSQLVALVAIIVLAVPSPVSFLIAAICLQVYFILDHVDGELARLYAHMGLRPLRPGGEYLDFWVHFHTANVAFATLGLGLSLSSGSPLWGVLGILGCNILGNFPKLALSRTLVAMSLRNGSVARTPEYQELAHIAADFGTRNILARDRSFRQKVMFLLSELAFFPGCVIVLPAVLVVDASLCILAGSQLGILAKAYLAAFVVVGLASKLRRTFLSIQKLNAIGS